METQTIQASPCPLCGEVAFSLESWSPAVNLADDVYLPNCEATPSPAHLQPCECTGCGTVHMVLTRS